MSEEKLPQNSPEKAPPGWTKMLVDFGPLIVFFATFKISDGDLMMTTAVFMATMVIAIIAGRILHGHVSKMLWFTLIVVMISGGLTLYLNDESFIKMKLTFINTLLGSALLFGLWRGKLYLKMLMEMAFDMADEGWRVLTRNYAFFMLVMAGVNEVIWRTQSTEFWVNFKTFGYMIITMVFMAVQISMLVKAGHVNLEEESAD